MILTSNSATISCNSKSRTCRQRWATRVRLRKRIFVAAKSGDPRLQVYIFTFAVLFSHMISGMGELCVLYYLIPSSTIFFTLYFAADMTPNTLRLRQEEAI